MSLYRKHRPQSFGEIIGQKHVSVTLLKQLQNGNFSHAYLFSGPRGTGKTSTARIFAKSLNCEKSKDGKYGEPCNKCDNCRAITEGAYLDVIEIDAASNRGIDEIRDLREKIRLAPTSGQFKVYIIDEAHMLTNEAFNALLKTLEEPPEHAVFILATTEPQKIPATIASRVQKYDFGKAAGIQLEEKLKVIKKKEGISIPDESLAIIAQLAEGSYRDAEVLLDKVISVNAGATAAETEEILGKGNDKNLVALFNLILTKKTKEAIIWLESYLEKGGNPKVLLGDIIEHLRKILLLKVGVLTEQETNLSAESFEALVTFSKQIRAAKLKTWLAIFSGALAEMRDSPIPSLPVELAVVEACEFNTAEVESSAMNQVSEEKTQISEPVVELSENKEKTENKIEELVVEKKVSKSQSGEVTISEIQKNWAEVLKKVKPHNNSLEIFLRGAIPAEIENDLITLEVGYRFHKDRLEDLKNNAIIVNVLSEVLGRPVRIKGKVSENRPKPEKKAEEQIEEVDPVEIFGKLV